MERRLQQEKEELKRTKKKLEKVKKEKEKLYLEANKKAEKIAKCLSYVIMIVFIGFACIFYLNIFNLNELLRWGGAIISIILVIFGFLGITVKTIKERIKNLIIRGLGLK